MQQREEDAADAQQQGGSPVGQDAAFQMGALDGGLFSSGDAAAPLWSGAGLPPRHGVATARRHPARIPATEGNAADMQANPTAQPAAEGTTAMRSATTAGALNPSLGPAAVGRRGSGGEVSGSLVRSVFDAVRSGFTAVGRALLPPSLHKLLDGE